MSEASEPQPRLLAEQSGLLIVFVSANDDEAPAAARPGAMVWAGEVA